MQMHNVDFCLLIVGCWFKLCNYKVHFENQLFIYYYSFNDKIGSDKFWFVDFWFEHFFRERKRNQCAAAI